MRCRICGRECPPEAKICRDCVAARKRAFAQTVTQPLLAAVGVPTVSAPRFSPKPLRPRAANDSKVQRPKVERPKVEREPPRTEPESAPALPLTEVPRRLSVLWLLGGVVLVAAAVGLLLRTSGGHASEDAAKAVAEAPVVPMPAVPVVVAPSPIAETSLDHAISEPPATKVTPIKPRKIAPRVEVPSQATAPPPPIAEPAPVPQSPTAAPRVVDAPRADPWQAMNEGLSRCAREALFDRIGCEQKLRLQYCGNSWGLVPQCPIGPATDHGQ